MPHVTFIHGLANKPPAEELHKRWLTALAGPLGEGLDLEEAGVSSHMVYWADVLYKEPRRDGVDEEEADFEDLRDVDLGPDPAADLAGEEKRFVESLQRRVEAAARRRAEEAAAQDANRAERVFPLPKPLERLLMKKLVRDAHHYLYNHSFSPRTGVSYKVRDELRQRFVGALKAGKAKSGPHVVVSHSMGTVIAYDCLKHVPNCPSVDALVTLGTPLGMSEVQDGFGAAWRKRTAFPAERLGVDRWFNLFDRWDVVSFADPKLRNDYRSDDQKVVHDQQVGNRGRDRHASREYLSRRFLHRTLAGLLDL